MTIHYPPPPEFTGELRAWQEKFRLWVGARLVLWKAFNSIIPPTHQISYSPPKLREPEALLSQDSQNEVPILQLYNPETGDMFYFPEYALDALINESLNPEAMRIVVVYLAQLMSEHGDHDKSLDTILKYGDPDNPNDREIIAYFCRVASIQGYAKVRPLIHARNLKAPESAGVSGVPHPELTEP